jgi:murein DD-endopeptidase MepM/ murein hydrolase activator NlpD
MIALVNSHWSLNVQRDAIDFVQLVDGKPYRGDKSRLESYYIYGDPLLAIADGRVTEAVDSIPDSPVGGRTWDEMAGNHIVLDIGDGHYVLYGHMKKDSLRVQVGDLVRRGQVIGQVGDSGNSDAPHLHIQVQNKPAFDVEDRDLRTYPILFDGATVSDLRRGDSVAPVAGSSR